MRSGALFHSRHRHLSVLKWVTARFSLDQQLENYGGRTNTMAAVSSYTTYILASILLVAAATFYYLKPSSRESLSVSSIVLSHESSQLWHRHSPNHSCHLQVYLLHSSIRRTSWSSLFCCWPLRRRRWPLSLLPCGSGHRRFLQVAFQR